MTYADWLPDPTARFEYRYWDGTQWTANVSTNGVDGFDPIAAAPTSSMDIDNTRVWLLAIAPALFVLLNAALLFSGVVAYSGAAIAIAIIVNTAIAVWDSWYLKSRGHEVSVALALFLVPAYLVQRSRTVGQSQAILVTWIAVFVGSLAGSAVLASHFAVLDMSRVETAVQSGIDRQVQTTSTISCPTKRVYPVNSTFLCDASDATGSGHVEVTVIDSAGTITWRLIG